MYILGQLGGRKVQTPEQARRELLIVTMDSRQSHRHMHLPDVY
jgi:hypothetical protein